MSLNHITIEGARTHNLKNIDVILPRDQLVVITGLSGSGKSSLAFDTLYAEGQRRYVESLSAYARQFLSLMEKPDVDHIEGLSPAISIEQKSTSHNPRSTVGTITEIHDYMRLLYARVGEPRCPIHQLPLRAQTISQMVDHILALPEESKLMILAPIVRQRKGEHAQLLRNLSQQGYVRARVDAEVIDLSDPPKLELHQMHDIDVVVDRIKVRPDIQQRLAESLETALNLSQGTVEVADMDKPNQPNIQFSSQHACSECGFSVNEVSPRLFSFNSPVGACQQCDGLGMAQMVDNSRIIHDPTLGLAQGAIVGWNKNHLYYYQQLQALAKHYDFDLDTPFADLPNETQNIILNGSGEEKVPLKFLLNGKWVKRNQPFEGVIPHFQRRYQQTDSKMLQEEWSKFITTVPCPSCNGSRLNEVARNVFVEHYSIDEIGNLTIARAHEVLSNLAFDDQRKTIAEKILKEICLRMEFLINVGLNYLTLSRTAKTLSGGESQRIRLASQIGAGLVGVMYVLDEPSIGLHQRDNQRLIDTLLRLRDLGNTVIVVEHDQDAILQADHVLDIGPGAGAHGGQVIAQGSPKDIMACADSITGDYLSGRKSIAIPKKRKPFDPNDTINIMGAEGHNLKGIDIKIPRSLLTCVTGVSGSGKSTLINETLYPLAAVALNGATLPSAQMHGSISGLDRHDKVVNIDQSPIGRTPRSNPATYTGLFSLIRDLFTGTPEARARGYQPGRFSFNVKGGRCEACQGDGVLKVEMHFLADIYVTCDQCQGKRYNRETLEVLYKGKNIHQVLEMTVEEGCEFFSAVPTIKRKLDTLMQVGLSYIQLGQRATTLSGGEAQRVKLAKELSRRDTGQTLYILDEPTTGLHFHDIKQLLEVLNELRDRGNTLIVIEHNLDVIKTADWIIDLGPEGGDGGGHLVFCGTPEECVECKDSHTGRHLSEYLSKQKDNA